ncbi:unnamed protein product, partial [Discosporangium mesarthrocarpum]
MFPNTDFSGEIVADIVGTVSGSNSSASRRVEISIVVAAVADIPSITTTVSTIYAFAGDSANISWTAFKSTDIDGSEDISLQLRAKDPDGLISQVQSSGVDENWPGRVNGTLAILPPKNYAGSMTLDIVAIATDVGVSGYTHVAEKSLNISTCVHAIAGTPILAANKTVWGKEDELIPLSIHRLMLTDMDDSETMTMLLVAEEDNLSHVDAGGRTLQASKSSLFGYNTSYSIPVSNTTLVHIKGSSGYSGPLQLILIAVASDTQECSSVGDSKYSLVHITVELSPVVANFSIMVSNATISTPEDTVASLQVSGCAMDDRDGSESHFWGVSCDGHILASVEVNGTKLDHHNGTWTANSTEMCSSGIMSIDIRAGEHIASNVSCRVSLSVVEESLERINISDSSAMVKTSSADFGLSYIPVADEPNLNSASEIVLPSYTEYAELAIDSLALIDKDGSETLTLVLQTYYDGFAGVISSGQTISSDVETVGNNSLHSYHVSSTNLSIWLLPKRGYTGKLPFNLTARATEEANGATASKTVQITGYVVAPSVLTFTRQSWQNAQTVVLTAVDDHFDDGESRQDFLVASLSSNDSALNKASTPNVTVVIMDNDKAGVQLYGLEGGQNEQSITLSCTEGGSCGYYASLLSQPKLSVHLIFDLNESSLSLGEPNITFNNGSLSWKTPQLVSVEVPSDITQNYNQRYSFSYITSSLDPVYNSSFQGNVNLTVIEDDVASVIISRSAMSVYVNYTGSSVFPSSYSVELGTAPLYPVTVAIAGLTDEAAASTSVMTFDASNYSTKATVIVSAWVNNVLDSGDLIRQENISHVVSSRDPFYNSTDVRGVTVKVWYSEDTIPAPQLNSAQFSDSLSYLKLTFDSSTDQGGHSGTFDCALIVDTTATEGLGDSATCTWPSSTTLRINFGTSPTLVPQDSILLLNDVLQSSNVRATLFSNDQAVTVDSPANPVTVVSEVNAPAWIGICEDLILDGSSSSGSGGRLLEFTWTLASYTDGIDVTNVTSTLSLYTGEDTLQLPYDVLESGATYYFALTAENFLGIADTSVIKVKKASYPAPKLSIDGSEVITVTTSDEVLVKMTASAPDLSCDTSYSLDSLALSFEWSEPSGYLDDVSTFGTANPRVLRIPRGNLEPGNTYQISGSVFLSSGDNNTDSVYLEVLSQALVASIDGGDREVGTTQELILDASPSHDPDESSGNFSFTWMCTDSTGVQCTDYNGDPLYLENITSTNVPANTVDVGTYTFTVLVTKGSRNATSSVEVVYVPGAPPIVSIQPLASDKYSAESGTYLQLQGSGTSSSSVTFSWAKYSGDDAPAGTSLFASTSVGTNSSFTVIDLGIMTAGSTYVFSLTAMDQSDQSATAKVSVVTNSAPTSGVVSVSPTDGYALEDTFTAKTYLWVDDASDYPLQYQLSYITGTSVSGEGTTLLKAYSYSSTAFSVLPGGSGVNESVTIVGRAKDRYDAVAVATYGITVREVQVEQEDLTEYLMNKTDLLINAALDSQDPDSVVALASTFAGTLNNANSSSGSDSAARADLR